MTGSTYEVVAVRYATRATTKGECFYRYESYGEPDAPLGMDYFFYVLRDGRRTALVDTGFDPDVGERRGRTLLCRPLEALVRLGVAPERAELEHGEDAAIAAHAQSAVEDRRAGREEDGCGGRDPER